MKDNTKPREDTKPKTEGAIDIENGSDKIKHKSDSPRRHSTEVGKDKDIREKVDHCSTAKQASNDNQNIGESRAIINDVTDTDKNTDSSDTTGFHRDQSKKPSDCGQEKGTLITDSKYNVNKAASCFPQDNSLQHNETYGLQGDKEILMKEVVCHRNKDMSACPGLSSEQIMETSIEQTERENSVKERDCQRTNENEQEVDIEQIDVSVEND